MTTPSRLQYWFVAIILPLNQNRVQAQGEDELVFENGETSRCFDIFAVEDDVPIDNAGVFCLSTTSPTELQVSFQLQNDWLMSDTSTWLGLNVEEDLPLDRNDDPQTREFPYQTTFGNTPVNASDYSVPLSDILGEDVVFSCPQNISDSITIFGVSFLQIERTVIMDGEEEEDEEADGWVDGLLPADLEDGGDLWTLFNVTLSCSSGQPATPAPTTPAPTTTATPPTFAPTTTVPLPTTPLPTTLAPTMTPLVDDGNPCVVDAECVSQVCSSTLGFCLFRVGQPCDTNDDICASGLCLNGICGSCDANQDSILTQDLVKQSAHAATLTLGLLSGTATEAPEVERFRSGLNKAAVAKWDGVCYGIQAPEIRTSDNLSGFGTQTVSAFQNECQVHGRAYTAYYNPSYQQTFALALGECAATCIPTTTPTFLSDLINPIISPVELDPLACPIVLTGHALGGSAAIVASMDLLDLSPTVITFGAPRTVEPDCPLAVAPHYRYVNLAQVPSRDTQLFDSLPQLERGVFSRLQHFGFPILLDDDDETNPTNPPRVLVLEEDDDTTRASIYRIDQSLDVNRPSQMTLYHNRTNTLLQQAQCFPLPAADRYPNGHWCDAADICFSGRCRAFLDLENGDTVGLCAQLLLEGDACTFDSDCASTVCNAGSCTGIEGPTFPTMAPSNMMTPAPIPGGTTPTPTPPPVTMAPIPEGNPDGEGPCGLCTTDMDCQSGVCKSFDLSAGQTSMVCAETPEGLMSDGCFCGENNNEECTGGRCEFLEPGLWVCASPRGPCAMCDEDSDCVSSNCLFVPGTTSDFVCGLQSGELPDECSDSGSGGGNISCEPCSADSDCLSEFCRIISGEGFCAETSDGRMEDGCFCDPSQDNADNQCTNNNCVRDDPFILTSGICQPPDSSQLQSCDVCQFNTDCASGVCINERCAQTNGFLELNCPCPPEANGNVACETGRCDLGEDNVEFVCLERLAAGEECDEDSDCVSGVCTEDDECEEGEEDNGGGTGQEGDACEEDADCAAGNFCDSVSDECTALRENGSSCSEPRQCQSNNCYFLTCDDLQGAGSFCIRDDQCESDNCALVICL